jgi:toxin-antitoxin system PIN domain toxin
MRCVDVNVLVYAHRTDLAEHDEYRGLLERYGNDTEPLGIVDLVLAGFLRVMTNRRVFSEPTAPHEAWLMVARLLQAPAAVLVRAGERHWEVFERLARSIEARGNDLTDAYLAACAVEHGATWVSADRGFARFGELRWVHPIDR